MPHNHPPRCCCTLFDPSIRPTYETCPSCVEHGELAALNSQPLPGCNCAGDLHEECATAECPSCHAVGDQPHTDYCKASTMDARPIDLPDPASVPYGTELDTYRAMGDPVRWVQHWASQTSQPAATTSQPPTQTRGGRIVDHPMSPPHPLTAACAPLCNHTGYTTTPPPPIDDYPR